jgi:glycerate dehydrogenase
LTIEPPVEKQLSSLQNCVITPHIAWASKQARQRLVDTMVSIIDGYIKGQMINQVV